MKVKIALIVVILFGCIASIDLFHKGFPVTHDGQDHIARIANFYKNLQEGILVPRWAPNLNWGYGHPILEFLYPFPSYVASFFHFLGFSFVDSTKLVFGISMIASGAAMYLYGKKLWGSSAGFVSGVLYMYAPYRLVDLYVRGDIGEHVAFIFIPLVFLGLLLLSEKATVQRFLFCCVSLALLILSHNAIALMVMPLVIVYCLYLVWNRKWSKKVALQLFLAIFIGFLLSSFFWVPALFEGQYTLRNIVTKGGYVTRFVNFPQLLWGGWNYGLSGVFTLQIGVLHWIALVVGSFWAYKKWKKERSMSIFILGLTIYTAFAIFLMLNASSFVWERIMLLQNFQFPWRFLAIPVFTSSILGGFCIAQLKGIQRFLVAGIVGLAIVLVSINYIHAKAYTEKPETFFTGIYDKTTDTGESSPIWSIRFMEYGFDKPLEVVSGSAHITEEKRLATHHTYTVSSQGNVKLLENTLYFPGWKILVDDKQVPVEFQDITHRGLMTFFVPDGTHVVRVMYQESKLRLLGDILSIAGIIGIIFLIVLSKYKPII